MGVPPLAKVTQSGDDISSLIETVVNPPSNLKKKHYPVIPRQEKRSHHFDQRVARGERLQTLRCGYLRTPKSVMAKNRTEIKRQRAHQVDEDDTIFRNFMLHYNFNSLHSRATSSCLSCLSWQSRITTQEHTKHWIEKKHIALRYILRQLCAYSSQSFRYNKKARGKTDVPWSRKVSDGSSPRPKRHGQSHVC